MTSSRPYLIRAMHEWVLDNNLTPHIVVNAHGEGVRVPQEYVQDGQITLNIAPGAVKNLEMSNDAILFSARFRGVPMDVHVPMHAVVKVYARENGQGMSFAESDAPTPGDGGGQGSRPPAAKKSTKPSLRVVK